VVYVPLPLEAVIVSVNAGVPVQVSSDGAYSLTVILPVPNGSTRPEIVTLSLSVVEPTVPLDGWGEVEMVGCAGETTTGSAEHPLEAVLLLWSPE